MDDEFRKRLIDYFSGPDLVEILSVPVEDLVDLLEDFIVDRKEDLDEFLNFGLI